MSREMREIEARLFNASVRLAEIRGYAKAVLDARRDALLADDELREALRIRAWFEAGERVRADGKGAPTGWPEGVDGDAVVKGAVEAELKPVYEQFESGRVAQREPESGFGREFRERVES